MKNLITLIENLKAFTIVVIENAFVYEDNAENILGKFCLRSVDIQDRILTALQDEKYSRLRTLLKTIADQFNQSPQRNFELEKEMPAEIYFTIYLSSINLTTLQHEIVIAEIQKHLNDLEDLTIRNALLKYGIYGSIAEAGYPELFTALQNLAQIRILIYQKQPSEQEVDVFFEEIGEIITETKSQFCLALIDKKLGTGDDEGLDFTKNKIIPRNKNADSKIICCLYTSHPNTFSLNSFDDYFIQEIGKGSEDKFNRIARTLAQSAYAHLFNKLNLLYQESAKVALDTVLKNQKNIKHIIAQSHEEGITGYDAIKYWYNLAHQFQIENLELIEFNFFAGLIGFFDSDHLDNHPNIGQIGKELKALNSFELFDFNVNKKYSPIAPGDIWEMDEKYYLLTGQLCDTLIRKTTNKRKAKLGELLLIELANEQITSEKLEKYSVIVKDKKKKIVIRNFQLKDSQYKNLEIHITTPTTENADLGILDLAMFNDQGETKLDLEKYPDPDALKILPHNFKDYYKAKQDELSELFRNISDSNIDKCKLLNECVKVSALSYHESNKILDYKIKRVARLKGRYYDSVYNNLINHKSRIDLNLIENANENVDKIVLNCSFSNNGGTQVQISNINLWQSVGKYYLKKQDLEASLPQNFQSILSFCEDQLEFGNNNGHNLERGENGMINLEFKYKFLNGFTHKNAHSYASLFDGAIPAIDETFNVVGEGEFSFIGDNERPSVKITNEQLQKGVTISKRNIKLMLINGILNRTEIDD